MTISSRDKGIRGELLARDFMRDFGYVDVRRGQQHSGSSDSPDVVGVPFVHFEVKFRERGHGEGYDWLAQAERDAAGLRLPVVLHKSNRKPWLVTLDAVRFMRLVPFVEQLGYSE